MLNIGLCAVIIVWLDKWAWALVLNGTLVILLNCIPLLTSLGWFHSGILGSLLWGAVGWRGWLPVTLYLILGSIVTKIGYRYKKRIGIAEAREGRRGAENVWGSAAIGALIIIICMFSNAPINLLLIAFSASFASKLADTFGSEIGKRWASKTVLITSFQTASPGTEGAISLEGTAASLIGSTMMTLIMSASGLISGGTVSVWVAFSGMIATLLESLIGATLQRRLVWLNNELVNGLQTLLAALFAIIGALIFNLI
uniref:TIGR00297 family protein n=1 Tax=Paulinella chromatophora TaxID=39717 RepID=B1X5M9_PAUCH|nr:hypothetical protein PCC_0838 [Paulinella chromatophora]ACB43248.1 hypothetical protein PCC_0838 [Paulinella chromatophora]